MSGPTANRLEPAFWWVVPARALGVGLGLTLTVLLLLVGEASTVLLVVFSVPALVALVAVLVSLLAPVAVYRERRTLDPDGEWYPSRWYYLLAIPSGLLPFVLSVVYTRRRIRLETPPRPAEDRRASAPSLARRGFRSLVATPWVPATVVLVAGVGTLVDTLGGPVVVEAATELTTFFVAFTLPYSTLRATTTGRPPRLVEGLRTAVARAPTVLGIAVVYLLVVAVGLLLLVLPGLYLGVRLATAFPACVVDGQGVLESLRTAWERGSGDVGRALLAVVIAVLGVVAVGLALAFVALLATRAGLPESPFVTVVGVLYSGVLLPTLPFVLGHLYLDRRALAPAVGTDTTPNTRVR